MKQIILSACVILFLSTAFAQAPEGFKYQAVVRNASGVILGSQPVGVRLTILQGSATGTAVYTETFTSSTNSYGLVNLEIGTGTTANNFAALDWSNGPYFIETAVDVSGGTSYAVMGTSQLMSVPYALYAKTAGSTAIDLVDDADADPTNELQNWGNLPGIPADILDGDDVDDADADPMNEIQDISLSGNTLSITAGSSVDLSAYLDNTDAQTLTLTGNSLSISNGNSVTIPDGDITDVVAGDGLTGGGSAGTVTLTANAINGLNVDAVDDAVELGGTLTKNTTIANGAYSLTHNLNGTGDFLIQDNGITQFEVRDNGATYLGNDMYWNDVNTSGTLLAAMIDDVDDGRFMVYENGAVSVDLDANTQFVFNEQGLDRDFRVESDNNAYTLMIDAANDRVGIGTFSPQEKFQVVGGAIMPEPGLTSGIHWPANFYGGGGDDPYIAYISQSGENTTLRIANQNDWDDDISFYQFDAERMVIYNGNVGIGVPTPAYQLELSINSAAKPTSNVWTTTSDRRLKKDIAPYTAGLEDLLRIEPVWFTYNGLAGMPHETGVGVIAQDLQEVAPYMVNTWQYREKDGGTTDYLGVDNGAMTYMLINAVKEQNGIITTQQTEIDSLKSTLERMEQRLNVLEKE